MPGQKIEGIKFFAINETLEGGSGNDTIYGYGGDDVLRGFAGNDEIFGGAGNDFIDGGFGFDTIDGGTGVDTTTYAFYSGPIVADLSTGVVSFPGNSSSTDTLISIENLIGSQGNDTIFGGSQDNVLEGGSGNDLLFGLSGNDTLIGGLGDDDLLGGFGNDRLNGYGTVNNSAAQIDTLTGGAGSDVYVLGDSNQVYYNEVGDGYAVIKGWSPRSGLFDVEYDRIEVKSGETYKLEFTSVSGIGTGTQDTEVYFLQGNNWERIGIIQDTTNVNIARDFTFV